LNPLDADKDFLHKMRGWLMTVATLFVGVAYQAVLQPPAWMTCFKPTPAEKQRVSLACTLYKTSNLITMATSLTMLVALVTIKKSAPTFILRHLKITLTALATTIAGSFIAALSADEYILSTSLLFLSSVAVILFSLVFSL
jgi:hypothetical protein